jgi:hypothetical protein
MKEKRLENLRKSFDEGIIDREEFNKKKAEIEEMPDKKEDEKKEVQEAKEIKLKSDKVLLIGIVIIIVAFIAVLSIFYLHKDRPQTIDDLHKLNFEEKLKPDQGYIYEKIYSFVKYDNLWYAQLVSPQGSRFYNIQFRYGPKDVDSIYVQGSLDTALFNNATEYYVTFNPTGNYDPKNNGSFSPVVLALGDFNQQMTKVFLKKAIAACDRNETRACKDMPIITCDNTDKPVLYIKESDQLGVIFNSNCITIEGTGFDLVKGVDRVLYNFYGIIK